MPYATQTDLERAIGVAMVLRLFDDGADGTVDSSTLADALTDADTEINGYVSRVYTVATLVAAPPPMLRRLAVDIAIQLGYLRRPELLNEKGETPWHGRYTRAVAMLGKIGKGEIRLDVNGTPQTPSNVRGAGLYTPAGPADPNAEGFAKDGTGDF